MTSHLLPRQPFGVLDDSRLQALTSIKNRQNNSKNTLNVMIEPFPDGPVVLSPNSSLKSLNSLKSPASAPAKKRLASDLLADDYDSENIDPSLALSPSKRSKTTIDTPLKAPMFVFKEVCRTAPSKLKLSQSTPLTSSLPSSITSTPSLDLRGSLPQNRRVSLLSNNRRIKTPFRRIDPLTKPSPLPFSIDAALSGTISSYAPPAAAIVPSSSANVEPIPAPVLNKKSTKSMPNTWFFDIHEDTPEQEATNLMEHSASILDISSDDDATSSRAKDAQERGKENVPPPEWTGPTRSLRDSTRAAHKGIKCPKKAAKYSAMTGPDVMSEDRSALKDLDATVFWVEDEESTVESRRPTVTGDAVAEAIDSTTSSAIEVLHKEEITISRDAEQDLIACTS